MFLYSLNIPVNYVLASNTPHFKNKLSYKDAKNLILKEVISNHNPYSYLQIYENEKDAIYVDVEGNIRHNFVEK